MLRTWEDLLKAERREHEPVRGAIDASIRLVHGPWGRLIALELDGPLDDLAPTVVRRGAEAISMRLVSRHREDELAAHSRGAWLVELAAGRMGEQEAGRRAAALGFERRSPTLVTAAAAWRGPQEAERGWEDRAAVASDLRTALTRAGMQALVGPHGNELLLLVDPGRKGEPDALAQEVAETVMRGAARRQLDESQLALAVGPFASSWIEPGRGLSRAARHVVVAAREESRLWHDARRVDVAERLVQPVGAEPGHVSR